ncbi:MAG: LCP family protein [Oscillospiraceae bacterium]|nr:LCP family protein [Oscillospiraceae bacterium]
MRNSKKNNSRRADAREPEKDVIRPGEDDGIDLAYFAPPEPEEDEDADIRIYQNFSNGYGRKVRNYSNNYGDPDGEPVKRPPGRQGSIPAYNQDFHREKTRRAPTRGEYRDYGADRQPVISEHKDKPRRKGCCGCGCTTVLMLLAALVIGGMILLGSLFEMPMADTGLGERKPDTATVLLCGTDKDGTRTDTMMLLYLDGGEGQIGLLSLPRDTLTITDEGKRAKLNSAYGRNGCGEEGMEWTMTYVERTIGYRPDGYILVDMELVPRIVDLMGGVDVHLDHHIRVHTDGVEVYVPAGDAHLNGEEVLATLRYRYGYANADLGRVEVQRMVITECMKQWVHPAKLALLPDALNMIQEDSLTDLSVNNFLWIGKTILTGMNNMTSDTLPGYADMRGGASYFVLYPDQVAELVNQSYNPYTVDVDVDDLKIAE